MRPSDRVLLLVMIASSFLVGVLVASSRVQAQTKSVSVEWDYLGVTPDVVKTYAQTVTFDGAALATPPVCVAKTTAPTGTTCAIPIPTPTVGRHVLTVKAELAGNSATLTVDGADPNKAPPNATNARFNITITIVIP